MCSGMGHFITFGHTQTYKKKGKLCKSQTMKDNTYKPKHKGMDDEGGGRKRQKIQRVWRGRGIKQRQPHSASAQASLSQGLSSVSFALSPDLEQGLPNLLAWQFAECERKCVCGERKRKIQ